MFLTSTTIQNGAWTGNVRISSPPDITTAEVEFLAPHDSAILFAVVKQPPESNINTPKSSQIAGFILPNVKGEPMRMLGATGAKQLT